MSKQIKLRTLASDQEQNGRQKALALFLKSPIPDSEKISQVGIFQKRQELSKTLFMSELYSKFINVHGVIMEFGTRWGQNLVTLSNLRGILEPYNYNRKIIGFDTFEGFMGVNKKDGKDPSIEKGAFGVTKGYENYLSDLLQYHQLESPLNHINKFELCKGDASKELEKYLKRNPQTIIAFAYFDFDIYEPTLNCLRSIKKHLVKGSVIGFDELNDPGFPGETEALREVFGLNNIKLERNKFSGMQSYFIVK
jgi:hypothetical protein